MAAIVETKDTIMGSEMEWLATITIDGETKTDFFSAKQCIKADTFLRKCIGPPIMPEELRFPYNGRAFLSNGARFYIDTGDHMEYCTPESRGAFHLMIHEKAGDKLMERGVKRANELWGGEGVKIVIYKSNLDRAKNSNGSHENYCVEIDRRGPIKFMPDFVSCFGLFVIVRPLIGGNGWIEPVTDDKGRDRFQFFLSQRSLVMEYEMSTATVSHRAIINLRNEPCADPAKYQRLHVIAGDALLFQPALFLRYGITSRVLRALLSGALTPPSFGYIDTESSDKKMVKMCYAFAKEESLRRGVDVNGRRLTLIDIHEDFCERTKRYYEVEEDMTDEDRMLFSMWEQAIVSAKEPRPHEKLSHLFDWAAKRLFVERDMDRREYGWRFTNRLVSRTKGEKKIRMKARDHVQEINARFHENSPRGTARRLMDAEDSGVLRLVPEEVIDAAIYTPFPDSRAYARHLEILDAVEEARRRGRTLLIKVEESTWSRTKICDETPDVLLKFYRDLDPFSPIPHLAPNDNVTF